jgi:hypothetical protein
MLVSLICGIYEIRLKMASYDMAHVLSSMKAGRGVRAKLRFSLSNMRGCNVGITEGSDLRNGPLR